jgi:hypothetical protein
MCGLFDQTVTMGQDGGPSIELVVFGDESYGRHETKDGYTVVHDQDLGLFCHATLSDGRFLSTRVPATADPPAGARRHLKESEAVRNGIFRRRFAELSPPPSGLGKTAADLAIGTMCHENGHLLCRFPDMYDYGERDGDFEKSAGIAHYCLMGAGNHLNNGRTPAPVCGYLRELAGWCTRVVELNQGGRFEAAHGDYATVMKYKTSKPNEHFIVENRAQLEHDGHLPSSGLAVYHCLCSGAPRRRAGAEPRGLVRR